MNVMAGGRALWLRRLSMGAALAICCLSPHFAPSGALAVEAESTNSDAHHEKAGGHEQSPGPMTNTKHDVDLAAWTLVTFIVFVIVLGKFAWRPLVEGLDKRETGILDNISAADAARVKAEKLLAEHAAKLDR